MLNICTDKATRRLFYETRTEVHACICSDFQRCDNLCMGTLNHPKKEEHRKAYEKPSATKLTPEEAKRKLIEHASRGSQDAKDLLEMIFAGEAKRLSTGKKKSA